MTVAPLGRAGVEACQHVGAAHDDRQQGKDHAAHENHRDRQGEREPRGLLRVEARGPQGTPRGRAGGVQPGLVCRLHDGGRDGAPWIEPRQEGGGKPRRDGDGQEQEKRHRLEGAREGARAISTNWGLRKPLIGE